jgi:hypothetical protein
MSLCVAQSKLVLENLNGQENVSSHGNGMPDNNRRYGVTKSADWPSLVEASAITYYCSQFIKKYTHTLLIQKDRFQAYNMQPALFHWPAEPSAQLYTPLI